MKLVKATLFAGITLVTVGMNAQEIDIKQEPIREAYSIGVNIGRNLQNQGITYIDPKAVTQGIMDAVKGLETAMTQEEMNATLQALSKKVQQNMAKMKEEESAANAAVGEKFLSDNKKRPEVMVTDTGLQYEIIKSGAGASPAATDKVKVHYRGTLLDGTEFDSSYQRNQAASFQLNRVIRGWTEGLQLMSPGSKYKFYIPSELAYGKNGSRSIPPNSTLIFEVELLDVVSNKPAPKPKVVTSDIIKVPSKEGLAKGEKIEIIKADEVEKEIKKQNDASGGSDKPE